MGNNILSNPTVVTSDGAKGKTEGLQRVENSPLTKILEEYRAAHKQFVNTTEEQ